ncbi:MAG TPA: isoprenylcysteine carboxylmethyltransferase family protein [Anaerolineales bacterium]|nr:isoprenylcysteine carboxylmethyltransferase family protein [Anaerolineales bacterium]
MLSIHLASLPAAVVAFTGCAAYGALHSWLASLPAKAFARRVFGTSADRFYRLAFNIVGTITLLPLLAFTAWQPGSLLYRIPSPIAYLFVAGQAAALAVIGFGLLQTGVWHFLGVRQLAGADGPPRLIADGLYRYVRHPLYSAGFVFLWLTPVMTSTLLALFACLSLYLYIGSVFEERRLVAEFGPAYQDYRGRVPRLLPRLRPLRSDGRDSAPPAA